MQVVAAGKRFNTVHRRVAPQLCRLWSHHNRRYDLLDADVCRDLIDTFQSKGGQQIPAIVRRITDGPYEFEVICGARRHWTAAHLNTDLLIEERQLTDEEAFALSDHENRARLDISDYERALDYQKALEMYYGGVQARMATILRIHHSALSRYLALANLHPDIVAAVADIRQLTRNHVVELKPLVEVGPRLSKYQAEENLQAVLCKARELAELPERLPAPEVIKLLKAEATAPTKGGRRTPILGAIQAAVSGRVAVVAKRKPKGGITLDVFGESCASLEEVKAALVQLADAHYAPPAEEVSPTGKIEPSN
jgi:ParB family chromosome partitioning protein